MSESREKRASYGALVLLVGPQDAARLELSQRLIGRGHSIVECSGPPGCPLIRGDECAIVSVADAVVVMPSEARDRETAAALSSCVDRARRALVVEPSAVPHQSEVQRVLSTDAVAIAMPVLLKSG
jgi:hypothetical protein